MHTKTRKWYVTSYVENVPLKSLNVDWLVDHMRLKFAPFYLIFHFASADFWQVSRFLNYRDFSVLPIYEPIVVSIPKFVTLSIFRVLKIWFFIQRIQINLRFVINIQCIRTVQ